MKGVGEAAWFYDFTFFGEFQGDGFSWGHLCYSVHKHGEGFQAGRPYSTRQKNSEEAGSQELLQIAIRVELVRHAVLWDWLSRAELDRS